MSRNTRIILTVLAVAVGTVAAPDLLGVFPTWAQAIIGGLAAGLAAVGIMPPQVATRRKPQKKAYDK